MDNLQYINQLAQFNLILVKDNFVLTSNKKGISPMIDFIDENVDLKGFYAFDIIVGKAVASLFILAGIVEVYGKVMSKSAHELLSKYGIKHSYGTLTDNIINRTNTGICPMELTVANSDNINEMHSLLKCKLKELKGEK